MTARWTVVSLNEATGQVCADWVSAGDEWEAFEEAARSRDANGENLADLELIAAIIGEHSVGTPSDSGAACWASDYPIRGVNA